MTNKICNKCLIDQPIENFYVYKGRIKNQCKSCCISIQTSYNLLGKSKVCTHCKLSRPLTEYRIANKNKSNKPCSQCVHCQRDYDKRYNAGLLQSSMPIVPYVQPPILPLDIHTQGSDEWYESIKTNVCNGYGTHLLNGGEQDIFWNVFNRRFSEKYPYLHGNTS